MMLLTGQAWTERCSAGFLLKLILRLFLFTALGYVGAKLVVLTGGLWDLVHFEGIYFLVFHLFFSYPLASKGITVVIVLPVHKLQYVIHKCAALSLLSHVASGV